MNFSYQPSSVNGVVGAVNGSMAAATNLLKMQALIDESRFTRQEKLHQKMLQRQTSEENFSKLRLQMSPRDSSYYEVNANSQDDNERFTSMWSSINEEHGNNRDMFKVLDKYKGGMGEGGYQRFKKDMDVALTRASMNAENDANDHKYIKSVTDEATGITRQAEMFDVEKWLAKQRGLGLGGNKEYMAHMTKINLASDEHLRGAGDKRRADLAAASATAKDAADAGKFQQSYSSSQGGAGSSMSVGADGSAMIVGAPSSPVLKGYNAPAGAAIELNALGASERDKSTGRGKVEHRSIKVLGTDANNQYIQMKGGTSALLGKLALSRLDGDADKGNLSEMLKVLGGNGDTNLKSEMLKTKSPKTDIDPNALGEEITLFINNPKNAKYAEKLTNLLSGKSLTPEEAGMVQDGGGGSGTSHTSSSSSGIQDKAVRGKLNKAAANLVPLLNAQMDIAKSTAPNKEAFLYGSQLARDLKAKLLAYAQEEEEGGEELTSLFEDVALPTEEELINAFGSRIK